MRTVRLRNADFGLRIKKHKENEKCGLESKLMLSNPHSAIGNPQSPYGLVVFAPNLRRYSMELRKPLMSWRELLVAFSAFRLFR